MVYRVEWVLRNIDADKLCALFVFIDLASNPVNDFTLGVLNVQGLLLLNIGSSVLLQQLEFIPNAILRIVDNELR